MTVEERARRQVERQEIKRREAAMFPHFHYADNNRDLQLICDEGDKNFITIRTRNIAQFRPSDIGGDSGWVEALFDLGDISAFAGFVAALSMRLKYMIEEANNDISKISAPALKQPEITKK